METVLRVIVMYGAILGGLRLLGKREFGQLSPLELITLLLIPDLVSQGVVGSDYSLTNALVALATLLAIVYALSLLSHRSRAVERLLEGEPALLVAHGKIVESALNRERIAPDEIYAEMHKVGLETLKQVRWAILETDGRISIVPAADR